MALTLNAEQKSIYEIFSGENQYIIPPYQRAYSWTIVQCKALFEDIKKAFYNSEQEGYFLGNIVLAKSREERNKLEVIDGQQRLTSLTLLLKVLLSFDKDNKALYNAIWIKDRRTDNEIQRLETNVFMEKDFIYFKEVLAFDFSTNVCNSVKKEDNLFKKNICYFYNELKEFSQHNDIFKFADFLLDYIYILPIETEDTNADKARKHALQVFETINNRGLNLSTSDIFKARLYSMALNELKHEEFINSWRELEKKCDRIHSTIDDIFRIYIYIYQKEYTDKWKTISLKEFFLEKKASPFFYYKNYNEIMKDLLRICDFTIFFIEIIQNPNINQELSKWFQLIHLLNEENILISLYIYAHKYDLNNYKGLISISQKVILKSELVHKIKVAYKFHFDKDSLVPIPLTYNTLALFLGICLDKNMNAISHYYFIGSNIFQITEEMSYEILDLNFLIDHYPELEEKILVEETFEEQIFEEQKREKLIKIAYKFIKEYNEN